MKLPRLSAIRSNWGAPYHMVRRGIYDLNRARSDETSCQFISSRGISKNCHSLVDLRMTYSTRIDPQKLHDLLPNTAIYIHTACIADFVANHLQQLQVPVTLVTGADDLSVSYQELGTDVVERLLDSPKVLRWFAQNAEVVHPKLKLIPIGIDYHMLAGNHAKPWRRFQSPLGQEKELLKVKSIAPPLSERMCTAYSNWHFAMDRGDRQECFDKIDKDCVFFEPHMVSRRQSWQNNTQHLFTISPLGNGLDCHRTWEALLLGTIPIVHTSPLDPLYEDLPVCIVQDWGEVTHDFLLKQRDKMLGSTYNYSKLYVQYWRELLRAGKTSGKRTHSMSEFNALPS